MQTASEFLDKLKAGECNNANVVTIIQLIQYSSN